MGEYNEGENRDDKRCAEARGEDDSAASGVVAVGGGSSVNERSEADNDDGADEDNKGEELSVTDLARRGDICGDSLGDSCGDTDTAGRPSAGIGRLSAESAAAGAAVPSAAGSALERRCGGDDVVNGNTGCWEESEGCEEDCKAAVKDEGGLGMEAESGGADWSAEAEGGES